MNWVKFSLITRMGLRSSFRNGCVLWVIVDSCLLKVPFSLAFGQDCCRVFSPTGAGPWPHHTLSEPRHCMVVSWGHLSSKLIMVGTTLFSFSKCAVEDYSWVRYPRLSLSSTRETDASREVFWIEESMWKWLSAARPDTDIHVVTKSLN